MIHRPVVGERCSGPADKPVVHTHGSVALLSKGRSVMHMRSAWTVLEGEVFLVPEGAPHYRVDHEPSEYIGVRVCMSCLPATAWGSARLGVLTALLRRASFAEAPRPHDSPIVARALDHIARHALEPLSLVDVARAVGRAPSHLATRVKAETGESVGAWIAHARMAHARERLLRGDDNVDSVAETVGYSSPSHFHRTFRRIHGLSPSAWRGQHRRGDPHRDSVRGGHGPEHAHPPFADAEAHVRTLDDPARDAWQRPEAVLVAMELAPTMRVADVGAGTGYFAVRLARALPSGDVTATDIEPNMVRFATERARREGLPNLHTLLAVQPGSGLARESHDRILVAHVWHHHPDRRALARDLSGALRPGGRLFVVDFAVEGQRGPPPSMRVAPESIIADLEAAGLGAMLSTVSLPDQYIVEARRDR